MRIIENMSLMMDRKLIVMRSMQKWVNYLLDLQVATSSNYKRDNKECITLLYYVVCWRRVCVLLLIVLRMSKITIISIPAAMAISHCSIPRGVTSNIIESGV